VQNTAISMSTSVLQILVAETRPHITQTAGALKIMYAVAEIIMFDSQKMTAIS